MGRWECSPKACSCRRSWCWQLAVLSSGSVFISLLEGDHFILMSYTLALIECHYSHSVDCESMVVPLVEPVFLYRLRRLSRAARFFSSSGVLIFVSLWHMHTWRKACSHSSVRHHCSVAYCSLSWESCIA